MLIKGDELITILSGAETALSWHFAGCLHPMVAVKIRKQNIKCLPRLRDGVSPKVTYLESP
jgi:hypothetical protein